MKIELFQHKIGQGKIRLELKYDPPLASTKDGHMVEMEILDFELYENPKNDRERQFNRMLLDRAEQIRSYRHECIRNGKIQLYRKLSELGFVEFYKRSIRELSHNTNYSAGLHYFREFTNDECRYEDVNRELFIGYREFLIRKTKEKTSPLSVNTAKGYFNQFRLMLRTAYAHGFVKEDLSSCDDIIHEAEYKQGYFIQKSQIHDLYIQECKVPDIKRMCFFFLLTRFRLGEIKDLDWSDVIRLPNEKPFIMKKLAGTGTGGRNIRKIRVFVSDEAMRFLGVPKRSGRVFVKTSYKYSKKVLREWVARAGLPSELVTFESFRRGFNSIEEFI